MARFDSCYTHGFAASPPRSRGFAWPIPGTTPSRRSTSPSGPRPRARGADRVPRAGPGRLQQPGSLPPAAADSKRLWTSLDHVRTATSACRPCWSSGLPLRIHHQLFNVAAVLHRGNVLGVVPKSYLPELPRVLREAPLQRRPPSHGRLRLAVRRRRCRSGPTCSSRRRPRRLRGVGRDLRGPLGADPAEHLRGDGRRHRGGEPLGQQRDRGQGGLSPGALRRAFRAGPSPPTSTPAAGSDESTTDLAWDGHALIAENGNILAESERFSGDGSLIEADVDLDRLVADRVRMTSYVDCADDQQRTARPTHHDALRLRRHTRSATTRGGAVPLRARGHERTRRALRRGVLDPAQRAGDAPARDRHREGRARRVGRPRLHPGAARRGAVHGRPRAPRTNVLAYTLPGFATSTRTLRDAHRLMAALGVTAAEIDIRPPPPRCCTTCSTGPPPASSIRPHLRERPGRRPHVAVVPAREHARRHRPRHRRPLRARAGLVHLRRRRSDVALRDQRLGTEDPHPVPDPLGRRQRSRGRRRP